MKKKSEALKSAIGEQQLKKASGYDGSLSMSSNSSRSLNSGDSSSLSVGQASGSGVNGSSAGTSSGGSSQGAAEAGQKLLFGSEWNEYFKQTYGSKKVKWSTKETPNRNGKNGGLPHQTTIDNIKPSSANGRMETEFRYNTPNGTKAHRYADKVEIVDGEVTKIYQAGKVNKNGLPVTREARAIEDIMNSPNYNGAPIYFMPYNSNIGPIIYLP